MKEGKITVHHFSKVGAVRTVVYNGTEYVMLDDFCRALHLTREDVASRYKPGDIKRVPLDVRPDNIVNIYYDSDGGISRVMESQL